MGFFQIFFPDTVTLWVLLQLAYNTDLQYAHFFLLLYGFIRDEMQTRWVGLHLHSGENSALFLPFNRDSLPSDLFVDS